jgi:hypothetical protein
VVPALTSTALDATDLNQPRTRGVGNQRRVRHYHDTTKNRFSTMMANATWR